MDVGSGLAACIYHIVKLFIQITYIFSEFENSKNIIMITLGKTSHLHDLVLQINFNFVHKLLFNNDIKYNNVIS